MQYIMFGGLDCSEIERASVTLCHISCLVVWIIGFVCGWPFHLMRVADQVVCAETAGF
jgi:hypothetical protein